MRDSQGKFPDILRKSTPAAFDERAQIDTQKKFQNKDIT